MRLRIQGESQALSRRETRRALEWFSRELLGPRLSARINIRLAWTRRSETYGYCEEPWDACPRSFEIGCVRNLTRRCTLQTLAHEMVHVKQYARRIMSETDEPRLTRWKKILVDRNEISYYKLPWEREARRMEKSLYKKYMQHLRKVRK